MKQLEQEKDILLQGLESVERAKNWYQKQIQAVQDKQKYIGKGSSPNVRNTHSTLSNLYRSHQSSNYF